MLHRKIYQLHTEGQEVCIYLRDQQRWIERARIVDIEGDLLVLRHETEEEDEICSWEELVPMDSVGGITRRLAVVPKGDVEVLVAEDCPEAEQIQEPHPDSNSD